MDKWYCNKCKEEMVEADVEAMYLDIIRFVRGLKCPKCGTAYLTEKTVVEVVGKGEEDIEAKLG